MNRSIMMHVAPADHVRIVKPERAGDTGSLEIHDAASPNDYLVLFPPLRPADAIEFLDALAEKVNELRGAIAAQRPELARVGG